MSRVAVLFTAIILTTGGAISPAEAQNRRRGAERGETAQGIPPGHLPPPGECRVWYDGRPPGQQPPPISCAEARAVAGRDRYARVIYGDDGNRRDGSISSDRNRREERRRSIWDVLGNRGERTGRDDRERANRDRQGQNRTGRAIPRERQWNPVQEAFTRGESDGYREGLTDGRDGRAPNPTRFSAYRSATRGYQPAYGSRSEYQNRYREGFRAGYDKGYRETSARTP